MAIIINQEKKPINWVNLIVTIVFIVLIFALTYFVFFKQPELIETVLPSNLQTLNSISQIQVDPTPVITVLKKYFNTTYTNQLVIPQAGRSNPFIPF
jgi:hypothetical protein